MDQDANRLDDFPDALGDDEILILDYDLDGPDDDAEGLYAEGDSPTVADPAQAEMVAETPRTMVVEEPRSGKWALIAVPFLLVLIGAGVWFQFFRNDGGDKPAPARRTASNGPARTAKKAPPAAPESRSPSVASVVNAGNTDPDGPVTAGTDDPEDGGSDASDGGTTPEPTNGATENPESPESEPETPSTVDPSAGNPGAAESPDVASAKTPAPTPTRTDGPAAFGELMLMTLGNGFAKLEAPSDNGGVKVRLKDGRTIKLAKGESLVQLKNGNHFKGKIDAVDDRSLTVAFAFGKMKIPQSDLNQIVDPSASDYLPLRAFKTGVVHLKNGNRLTGKIMKVTTDRVILGFPSAKIVVSRAALKNGLDSIEYTEEGSRERVYGVSASNAALGLRPGQSVETLLGVPYYDFEYGFRIVPPKHWTKFSKDAVVGFNSTPISAITGCLTLGGLFLSDDELAEAIRQIPDTLGAMPGTSLLGNVRDMRAKSVPWSWEFDCVVVSDKAEGASTKKRCRTYVFSKGKKTFILSIFSPEQKFELVSDVLARSAKSFEFRN